MNRFSKKESLLRNINDDNDDEEQLYERQALIDEQELCDDEFDLTSANPLGVRQRQAANKTKAISKHYSNDLENRALELRSINRTRDYINEPIVEYTYYDIQPGDSLQSICLRYACSMNHVKRLNSLMSDQDFYGLRRIKLPLGKFGLLEDVLKLQQNGSSSGPSHSSDREATRSRLGINSPGSALSVSTRRVPQFKPLLSPGFSSDRINDLKWSTDSNQASENRSTMLVEGNIRAQHSHSHSFSSLREFAADDTNINIGTRQHNIDTNQLNRKNFIKSNLNRDEKMTVDDLIMSETDTVGRVFEDLDYHVSQAKAAAQTYDQRAAELVDTINIEPSSRLNSHQARRNVKSELFFCNENFGMNYKKLFIFIFVVCFVVPLVYIRQTTSVAT